MTTDTEARVVSGSVETFLSLLDAYDPTLYTAQENLGFMSRMLDFFERVVHNVFSGRSFLGKAERIDFKRSELDSYLKGNARASAAVLKLDPSRYADLTMVIPTGMTCTFDQAIRVCNELYAKFNTDSVLTSIEEAVKDRSYFDPTAYSTPDVDRVLVTTAQSINFVDSKRTEASVRSVISNNRSLTAGVGRTVFEGPLSASVTAMQSWGDRYRVALAQEERMRRLEGIIGTAIDNLTHLQRTGTVKLRPAYLEAAQALIRTAAVQIDLYGAVLHLMQQVEHNFVLNLYTIQQKAV